MWWRFPRRKHPSRSEDSRVSGRAEFVRLLEHQVSGHEEALTSLHRLNPDGETDFYLRLLWNEWSAAFCYVPGRTEALKPLLALARRLESGIPDHELGLYTQPDWTMLRELTGPAECIQVYSCSACHRTHVRAGTSGFLDEVDWVCANCGDILFKDGRDIAPPSRCRCGTDFTAPSAGCPWCGHSSTRATQNISPYQYFATHRCLWQKS
jgi:hypothetical protein